MNRPTAIRSAWHPQTVQDRDAVLRELQEVVNSPHFCNSKRYPALLQFIVENTLAGKQDHLKERTLGIEVFDRPPTYDTNADTVVRYTAGEVRKRLLLYYSEPHRNTGIRISLPAGSYVPEFLHGHNEPEEGEGSGSAGHAELVAIEAGWENPGAMGSAHESHSSEVKHVGPTDEAAKRPVPRRLRWAVLGLLLMAIAAGIWLRWHGGLHPSAVDDFWSPVLRDQRTVLVCTGGVVFQQNNFSGVVTAGKDIEYPFVSMQIASAISQVSGLLERSGKSTQLFSSPTTPLTELREHSVVLLGGYNNQWAMRLLQAQRFQFTPEPVESIIDRQQPGVHWARDRSLSYASADDYALVARFRDSTTDGWVVVLAGLGRNGTEAAAQFATSPRYMQMFKERLGNSFSSRNLEAVLKVSVIDGKTGPPSILAVHMW